MLPTYVAGIVLYSIGRFMLRKTNKAFISLHPAYYKAYCMRMANQLNLLANMTPLDDDKIFNNVHSTSGQRCKAFFRRNHENPDFLLQ